jgi:hypothetical protein
MSNNDKQPQDQLKEAIKLAVASANGALEKLHSTIDEWKKPVSSAVTTVEQMGSATLSSVQTIYARRHEYAPELIGCTALVSGGFFFLRRGRVAGILGGAIGAGAAYAVVYDEINFEQIPNVVFGDKK